MKLSHLDDTGAARMVDVSSKDITARRAVAQSVLRMSPETVALLATGDTKKGDAIATARIAGIQAAKKTSELIPLCHHISLDRCAIDCELHDSHVTFTCTATATARTGVEMEALVGACTAALTLYDMLKYKDKQMEIGEIHVVEKTGGTSGDQSWAKSKSES